MKSHKFCPKCNTQLRPATKWWEKDAGYEFLCDKCEENYFHFEALTLKDMRRKNVSKADKNKTQR